MEKEEENSDDESLAPYPASEAIQEKIEVEHGIQWHEVEEVFTNEPWIILMTARDQYGEARYAAYGQTDGGRYLMVAFVPVRDQQAKVITAREMTHSERRRYRQR